MADKKISALTAATTPLAGTEVLPIVQGGATVKVSAANITAGRDVSAKTLTGESNGVGGPTEIFARNTAGSERVQIISRNSAGISYIQTQNSQMLIGSYDNFAVQFMVNNSSKLLLDTNSDVKVQTGNLVVGTAGKGIDFSANTHAAGMTSELLDWYEEGTWTPSFNQGFVAPVSYTTQTGKYTRIGDMVYFHAYIYMDAGQTRDAAALGLAGLPFPVASGSYVSVVWNYAAGVVAAGTALPTIYAGNVFYDTGGAPFLGTALTSARPEFAISGFYKTT